VRLDHAPRESSKNPLPPDIRAATLRLARALARQAAREDHAKAMAARKRERGSGADETGSNADYDNV
jgi:hypothetical protein